jgi:uncharacterized repeat protein (TIGR03803 family)
MPKAHKGRDYLFHARVCAAVLILLLLLIGSSQGQTLKRIYEFTGGEDGWQPFLGLAMDGNGSLYGTTLYGGSYRQGSVFRLSREGAVWKFQSLYSFPGGADGANPWSRLALGPKGTLYGTTWAGGQGACHGGGGCGTLYQLSPPENPDEPWKATVLHRFAGQSEDGANPMYGNLTLDEQGNIYGTTYQGGGGDCLAGGGDDGCGIVFQMKQSGLVWTENILHRFKGIDESDGAMPHSGVIFDKSGNLWGATTVGGIGCGTIYELLAPSWTVKIVYNFQCHRDDGGWPMGDLAFDQWGSLYGATEALGGLFQVSPSDSGWAFHELYVLSETRGGAALDKNGNVYVATYAGGAKDLGAVVEFTRHPIASAASKGGWSYRSLHEFTGGVDGLRPHSCPTVGPDGHLFGTIPGGGAFDAGYVYEIVP